MGKNCDPVESNASAVLPYKYLFYIYIAIGVGYVSFKNNNIVKVSKLYKLYPSILCFLSVIFQFNLLYKLSNQISQPSEHIVKLMSFGKCISIAFSVISSWVIRVKSKKNISFEIMKNYQIIDGYLNHKEKKISSIVYSIHIITFLWYIMEIYLNILIYYTYLSHFLTILLVSFLTYFVNDLIALRFFTKMYGTIDRLQVLIARLEELFDSNKTVNKGKAIEAFMIVYTKLMENIDMAVSEFGVPVIYNIFILINKRYISFHLIFKHKYVCLSRVS